MLLRLLPIPPSTELLLIPAAAAGVLASSVKPLLLAAAAVGDSAAEGFSERADDCPRELGILQPQKKGKHISSSFNSQIVSI